MAPTSFKCTTFFILKLRTVRERLLEHAVAMREVSGSSPGQGGHKNLCRHREPSDYISFRNAIKRQRFHTLNTHDTKPKTTQQHSLQMPYMLEPDLSPFLPDAARSFPSE